MMAAAAKDTEATAASASGTVELALANVMAGNGAALEKIIADASGPAAYMVRPIAEGLRGHRFPNRSHGGT